MDADRSPRLQGRRRDRTSETVQRRAAWLFLWPSLVLYSLYVLLPIFYTFYLSFTDWDGVSALPVPICVQDPTMSCLANFRELMADDVFWRSLGNNLLWLALFGLSPLMGLGLALFFHVKGRMAAVYKSLLFMPMVFSLVVIGLIWGWFFQPELGLVDFALHRLGILGEGEQFGVLANFQWVTVGLIVAASWPHAAYCLILFLAGLSNLQKNVIEAAMIDGVSRWQMLWHVVLPMLRPATVIVIIVTLIGALRTFELVQVMTGGGPANASNVLANYMYQQTFQSFRYGYGAAIAVVLFAVSFGLILTYLRHSWRHEI